MALAQQPSVPFHGEVVELFLFCQEVLQERSSDRVKDIDVGRGLLGFNYKYTSQFRHGIIKLRHVLHLRRISKNLGVPNIILVRILRGEWNHKEAIRRWKRYTKGHTKLRYKTSEVAVDLEIHGQTNLSQASFEALVNEMWMKAQQIVQNDNEREKLFSEIIAQESADRALVELEDRPLLSHVRRRSTTKKKRLVRGVKLPSVTTRSK